jgi:hypothetical protein
MPNKLPPQDVGIYEPIYLDGQTINQNNFIPYPHTSNKEYAHWREFRIHVDMYRKRLFEKHVLTGLFSPKFELKTKITGAAFAEFCVENADADVVFINPFPHLAYISFNIWMQAETNHTGIVDVANRLLEDAGVNLTLDTEQRHDHSVLAYSSFWCGNAKFWEAYVGKILSPIASFIENNPEAPSVKAALQETFHTDPSPYLPFITERLFTTFISQEKTLRLRHYQLTPEHYCFNKHEIDFIIIHQQSVDKADKLNIHSQEMKQIMQNYCNKAIVDAKEYYKKNPHPHTGRTID